MYISIDPGGTTGYVTFAPDGAIIDMEFLDLDEVRIRFTKDIEDAQAVICESWRMRPEMAKHLYWSDMPTSQLIGWLDGACAMKGVEFVLQAPSIKPIAYKHWGRKPLPKSNPMNHAYDAAAHGREFLLKRGVIHA